MRGLSRGGEFVFFGGQVREYELVMLINPEADAERLGAVVERVRRIASEHGGEIVSESSWGKRKLAYKIGPFAEANYHLADLQMEGAGTKALDTALKLSDDVLRHLLIRKDD